MQTDSYLLPCIKLKSKWIKDFNINPDTMNCIEEKVGNDLEHTGPVDNYLDRTPIVQALKQANRTS